MNDLNINKKAEFKSLLQSLGVEMIYAVNLPERVDRRLRLVRELEKLDLPYKIMDGVKGRDSYTCEKKYQAMLTQKHGERSSSRHISPENFQTMLSKASLATVGYLESQKKIFQDAATHGYKNILVLDDDIIVHEIAEADKDFFAGIDDFRIILLGASEYTKRYDLEFIDKEKRYYHPVPGKTCGSFAVIYNQSLYDEILELIGEYAGTFDNCVLGHIYEKYQDKCYVCANPLIFPDLTESDIQRDRDHESQASAKNWPLEPWREYRKPALISVIITDPELKNMITFQDQHLGKNVFVNFHMPAEEGMRAFHPAGGPFSWHERHGKKYTPIEAFGQDATPETIRKLIDNAGLPYSEIVLLWREDSLDRDKLKKAIRQILDSGLESGMAGKNVWARKAGKKAIPGLHSVIIPSIRSIDALLPTLRSVMGQTAENVEIIVVNDNPQRVIGARELESCFLPFELQGRKYIRVINHRKNLNGSAARNTGLSASNGEYVSFLDDDDIYLPGKLKNAERAFGLKQNRSAGALYCGWRRIGTQRSDNDSSDYPHGNLLMDVLCLHKNSHLNTDTITFRRDYILALNGFDEYFERHQDIELMTRYFQYFNIGVDRHIKVHLKSGSSEKVFIPTLDALTELKLKYLTNFRHIIAGLPEEGKNAVLQAHVDDIKRYFPDEDSEIYKRILHNAVYRKV